MASPLRLRWLAAIGAAFLLTAAACGDDDDETAEPTPFTRAASDDEPDEPDDADQDEGDDDAGEARLSSCGLEDAVAAIVGEEVVESGQRFGTVGRSTDDGDLQLNDEGCGYELASGDRVVLADVVDGDDATAVESYEALQALVGEEGVVEDLGDSAVLLDDDKLYVRVGDRIVVVKFDTDDGVGVGVDPGTLASLAAEAIALEAG